MPPRKRAASAPKSEDTESVDALAEDESTDPAAATSGTASSEPTPGGTAPEPGRSDLQAVSAPCADCFPGGWPAQSFAVGCAHGTWQREATG